LRDRDRWHSLFAMSQRPRISVTQTQRLHLTAGLQTSIALLRADAAGLTRYLEEQADLNPHLRLLPPPGPQPGEWLPRWAGLIDARGGDAREHQAPAASLMAHVMAEAARLVATPRDRRIAYALAEALEPSGWLGRPLSAIARDLDAPVDEVEAVLARLQKMDPAGLFARNLAECLALQLAEAGQLDPAMQAILDRLDLLASGDLVRLARQARLSQAEIAARFRLIRGLDPKPGAQFAAFSASAQREPDLLVRRDATGGWECALNRSSLPSVQIVEVTGRPGARDPAALAAARAVTRLVATRNATLLRVGREVLERQKAALEAGTTALQPMTMAEVGDALDLHESTISRVVAGVSIDTPRGTWWLRRLFSARLGADGGPQASNAALQARLERLVAAEAPGAPLSDAALAQALARDGPEVARRTVAKYRAALGIPPAHRRRRRAP